MLAKILWLGARRRSVAEPSERQAKDCSGRSDPSEEIEVRSEASTKSYRAKGHAIKKLPTESGVNCLCFDVHCFFDFSFYSF